MTYLITIAPENHGYTIRLVKNTSKLNEKEQYIESFETIATLAIENSHKIAMSQFDILNSLIRILVKNEIIDKDVFRYKGLKE